MSRIGKLPVVVPDNVKVTIEAGYMAVEGPKGALSGLMPPGVEIKRVEGEMVVEPLDDSAQALSSYGLARTLLNNMVVGVTEGYSRKLLIEGTGYRVEARGPNYLYFVLGYSHPILYHLPEGITAVIDAKAKIPSLTLSGANRQLLGSVAAEIRAMRPPEPYKGKGVRYSDEVIRRKEGKTGK